MTDELPPLRFRDLHAGMRLGPSTHIVGPDEVAAYVAVTGDDNPMYRDAAAARAAGLNGPIVPPGLVGVWARSAYLAHHRMLPGGVMAGQDIELFGPVPVGTPVELLAEVEVVDLGHPRRRVVLRSEAHGPSGLVARVRIDARWPSDDGKDKA